MTEHPSRTEPNDFTEGIRQAAAQWDTAGGPPRDMVERMAKAGLLGADLPTGYGGSARSALRLGDECVGVNGEGYDFGTPEIGGVARA
ncbi:acyl-CoA dehydrogenase family protein, partial [Streptomyces eurythermus]